MSKFKKNVCLMFHAYPAIYSCKILYIFRHFGCYTMDVIASTAFGLRTDAYSHPEEKFVSLAQKVFGQSQFGPNMLFACEYVCLSIEHDGRHIALDIL